ncbi:unnamed protein product, partial [Rhizoctonia solani]
MSNSTHPQWGRALDDYIGSFDLAAAKKRTTITPLMEAEAAELISKVFRLSGPAQWPDPLEAKAVTIQVLDSILVLALCPRTFHYFANPPLISGCVKLIGTVQVENRIS